MLWDLFQQQKIEQNAREISDAQRKVRGVSDTASSVSDRMDRIALVTNAVWELLKERTGASDRDLLAKIEEVDGRDGSKDGKVSSVMKTCLGCSRKISTRNKLCVFCGAENRHYSPFA